MEQFETIEECLREVDRLRDLYKQTGDPNIESQLKLMYLIILNMVDQRR